MFFSVHLIAYICSRDIIFRHSHIELSIYIKKERFFITSLPIKLMLNDFYLTIGSHFPRAFCSLYRILEAIGFPLVTPAYLN